MIAMGHTRQDRAVDFLTISLSFAARYCRLSRHYRYNSCCWWMWMCIALAVFLIILLPSTIVPRQKARGIVVVPVSDNSSNSSQVPLEFVYRPQLLSAGNTSIDVQLALTQAGLVYYVLLPGQASQRHLLDIAAAAVGAAASATANGAAILATAAGQAGTGLEVSCCYFCHCLVDHSGPRHCNQFIFAILYSC